MDAQHHSMEDLILEHLIEHGPEGMLAAFTAAYNMVMKVERERFIGAGRCERAEGRRAFANGYKRKRIDTPAGTATLSVPKTARHGDTPFHPTALQRGRRCEQAVMAAAATMYLKGVSTRDVEDVLAVMGVESMSATQVSNATKGLDEELERWCSRGLAETRYLILDARYEKVRIDGIVRDAAILTAIGVVLDGGDPSVGRRRVLGVYVALSEAEVHWREFLDSLVARGMRGVEYVVSDDHARQRFPTQPGSAANAICSATPSTGLPPSQSGSGSGPSCGRCGARRRSNAHRPSSTGWSQRTGPGIRNSPTGSSAMRPRGSPSSASPKPIAGRCGPQTASKGRSSRS